MHYLLVGPGALGCLLYSLASKGKGREDRITLLDYNRDRASCLAEKGITFESQAESFTVPVTATTSPKDLGRIDVVLLCVKSYDVQGCIEFCAPILGPDTLLVFLQNGISHLNPQALGLDTPVAYGTTTEGATLLGKGHVKHAGSGVTYLGLLKTGEKGPGDALLQKTAKMLECSGLLVFTTTTILTRLWAKLFINVGINALTATLDCPNGKLLVIPGAKERMAAAVEEACAIARAKSIDFVGDPLAMTCEVAEKTASNISSMLQDVRNERRTEIDAINGAISAMGVELGIPTPENHRLTAEIKTIEAAYGHS